jgi:hypothetical protein
MVDKEKKPLEEKLCLPVEVKIVPRHVVKKQF